MKEKNTPTQPGPWRITFDTNPDDCNLSCIMCEDHSPFSRTRKERIEAGIPKRRMDMHLIRRMLENAENSPLREIIPSTMGEPLVYKQFDEILELCQRYNIKLNLTTNGTFPIKGALAWAKQLVPVTSDVKISWNGATKATQQAIMLGTQWEKVVDNVKTFIRVRDEHANETSHYCTVTFQMTFLETNFHELADIVALGIELGIDRIKGHHLWAHFKEIQPLSMRRSTDAIKRWNEAVIKAEKIALENPLPNGKYIKLENIYCLDEQATEDLLPEGVCPFLGKEAWIATDGRFNPCCAPDKLRRQLGEFGNLNEVTLTDIWRSNAYQDLMQNYMQNDVCKHCNMRKKIKPEEVATNGTV